MKSRYKLDPNKSAIDNLWDCARVAAKVLLRKYHIRSIIDDKYIDLYDELVMQTVVNFMYLKIRQHDYDRRFDFFSNVYSAAWSCQVLKKHFEAEKLSDNVVPLTLEDSEGGSLEATLASSSKHSLDIDNSDKRVKEPHKYSTNTALYKAEDDLNMLWAMDDLESDGTEDKLEIAEHREAIMRRVKAITQDPEFIRKKKLRDYSAAYRRRHNK